MIILKLLGYAFLALVVFVFFFAVLGANYDNDKKEFFGGQFE